MPFGWGAPDSRQLKAFASWGRHQCLSAGGLLTPAHADGRVAAYRRDVTNAFRLGGS